MKAIILAGGENERIGQNKAFIRLNAGPTIIENQIRLLRKIFTELLIVTNSPQEYQHLGVKITEDIIPHKGSLGGIYSGLFSSESFYNFFLACDLPFIHIGLIAYMKELVAGYDVVIPRTRLGYEPLSAFYSRNCLSPIKRQMDSGNLKIVDFFPRAKVRTIEAGELNKFDPEGTSFLNINTQKELEKARRIALRRINSSAGNT